MSGRIGIPVLPWEKLSCPCQDATFCTSREEAESQVVTRLIDLFVDIAVLLRKKVYRFSSIRYLFILPKELLDTCTMLPLK